MITKGHPLDITTHLTLLALRSANLGLTFSSPITKYNLTIQNTAALRTIDSSTSASYDIKITLIQLYEKI